MIVKEPPTELQALQKIAYEVNFFMLAQAQEKFWCSTQPEQHTALADRRQLRLLVEREADSQGVH